MEKRYQVFVSSTFTDLMAERKNVMQALLELDCIPAGMELFPAADEDQWDLIKQVIDDCDYYVVVIGGRYGSTTAEGISYTEKEFDYAVEREKPILAFLHQTPEDIPAGKTEMEPAARAKLTEFRRKAEQGRMCKYWTSADDLGAKVSRSLVKAIKTRPAEGWVKGRYATTPEYYSDLNELREENTRLKIQLESAGTTVPEGTDRYAGGSDVFVVTGKLEIGDDKRVEDWEFELTWDEIFSYLGPILFQSCSESRMQTCLASALRLRYTTYPQETIKSFAVDDDVFQATKIQLLALGLIMISERHDVGDPSNLHWTLTPFGKSYLLKVRAIRKDNIAPAIEAMKSQAIQKNCLDDRRDLGQK